MASSNTFTTQYADILLTEDGDLDLTTSSVQLTTTNTLSLKQRLNLRLAIWEQEWKYYVEYGTPWRSYLSLGIAQAKSAIDQEVKRQVKKEIDVINIYNFVSTLIGRFYSCSMSILTEEGTFDFAANLKDDFTYQIPSYSIGCDKIVEYQYWSSAPYDYLTRDSLTFNPLALTGSMLDPIKEYESISVSYQVQSYGELRDVIVRTTQTEQDIFNTASVNSGWLQTYTAGVVNVYNIESNNLLNHISVDSAVLTTVVINTDQMESTSILNSINITSGVITG